MVIRHRRTNKILYKAPEGFPKRFDGANLAGAYFGDSLGRPFWVSRWIDAVLGSGAMFVLLLLAWKSVPSEAKIHSAVACSVMAAIFAPGFCINILTSLSLLKSSLTLLFVAVGGSLAFQESSLVLMIVWVLGLVASVVTWLTIARNYMQGMDLQHADFSGCCLDEADFSRADLRSADFRNASLRNVVFKGANLKGAVFSSETTDDRRNVET